jgi:hypothetical protein
VDHVLRRILERACQAAGALAIALEQVERHALRGLRTDARQHAQGLDEAGKTG